MASTLLLADSNPTIHRIVAMTFAGQEFKVVSVNDGDEAISAIAAERPDIVLADVSMPKRNGYEVAAFVKQRPDLAHIPVLLLAGALEPVDEARAMEAKCDGVLVKPFEPYQVVARVRELVQGGQGHPTQTIPGVPRAIERLIEPRGMAMVHGGHAPDPRGGSTPPPGGARNTQDPPTTEEPPSKIVKHPSAPARPDAPAVPAAAAAKGEVDDPLGDYFDQLDVAFGTIDPPLSSPVVADVHDDETERLDVPTLSSVLGEFDRAPVPPSPDPLKGFKDEILFAAAPVEPPDIRPVPPATVRDTPAFWPEPVAPRAQAPPSAQAPPVDLDLHTPERAFEALIAADQQARDEERALEQAAAGAGAPLMNDALIDAVAARVIEKLAPNGVTDLVSRVVADVTERLVREEIERIRGRK